METGSTRIVIPAMDATDGRGDGMAEILHVDEFEGKCGFAYRHEPFCNGGHNCRHPEAATEKIAGKEVGYCYAFSCPLAPTADKESFEKNGMGPELYEEDMYVEIFDGLQEKKDEGLKALWTEFGRVPMNPETECIEEDWRGWKAGTFREDIWHWFDERHSKGVAYLMFGGHRKVICRRCGSEVQEENDAELRKEYPYYCPECDQNMYSFECKEE